MFRKYSYDYEWENSVYCGLESEIADGKFHECVLG